MPSSTPKLREEWDGPSDEMAVRYLKQRGYTLTRKWEWLVPNGLKPTEKDKSAVRFLIEEWDFGGFCYNADEPQRPIIVSDLP